ncbi:MAG: hypothetical protein K6B67_04125 [Lachnospiraceae bacterium]|nr:hypothetical protein [Lachnospiraceae bacterium]
MNNIIDKYIEIDLDDNDIDIFIDKYHFQEKDRSLIEKMYETLRQIIKVEMIYRIGNGTDNEQQIEANESKNADAQKGGIALVTLGNAVDELIDEYNARGEYSEGYILDCLGLYILSLAYRQLVKAINIEEKCRVTKLNFIGDKYPLSMVPNVFEKLDIMGRQDLTFSKEYMINPLKTTTMVLETADMDDTEMSEMEITQVCHICANCNNINCPVREV